MELEKLIERHNEILDKKVNENSFLEHRFSNMMKQNILSKQLSSKIKFGTLILRFGLLVFIFVFLNFKFVEELEKLKTPSKESIDFNMVSFRTDLQKGLDNMLNEIIK